MTSIVPFQQLADLCSTAGVEHVIISPGSRNAALTIAFTSHPKLNCYSISDERSAAYVALGMALVTGKPAVIICTSGTAALNYAPAIAEAFFQEIPLLVITADRPPEWIHQYDGQTIYQDNVYGKHVKASFSWSADQDEDSLRLAKKIATEALQLCQKLPLGPVHINIPIREPFYPDAVNSEYEKWEYQSEETTHREIGYSDFHHFFKAYDKKLLVIGQQHDHDTKVLAAEFARKYGFVLIGDIISNIQDGIKNQDVFIRNLSEKDKEELKPDLLISTDMSLISKSLKLLLRTWKIEKHLHVQDNPLHLDPFRSLTDKVEVKPALFFKNILKDSNVLQQINAEYLDKWADFDLKAQKQLVDFFERNAYSEFHILQKIVSAIPPESIIHVGNSMSVRYLNFFQNYLAEDCMVFANRGTSGIDGRLSTAVGQAMVTTKNVYCILGDVSFQYDKNALWNRYLPDNLKIIIINNAGGIIFSMIDGPKKQHSFEDFFRTSQPNKADLIAEEFKLAYYSIKTPDQVEKVINAFISEAEKSILEIFTDYDTNEKHFKSLFST